MKYERTAVISNLYELSKSTGGTALLKPEARKCVAYSMDAIKESFCKEYRHENMIKSCDAYYYDQHNNLVVEFKNTHCLRLKEFYPEIEVKILDTHMLLSETFWKSKKNADIGKKVQLLVVYNDAMNYEDGVLAIGNALNGMIPKCGDKTRKTKLPEMFQDLTSFEQAAAITNKKYQTHFYKEIVFMDKKDFERDYIDADYFQNLAEWAEVGGQQ